MGLVIWIFLAEIDTDDCYYRLPVLFVNVYLQDCIMYVYSLQDKDTV